jgi:hypothetical protein
MLAGRMFREGASPSSVAGMVHFAILMQVRQEAVICWIFFGRRVREKPVPLAAFPFLRTLVK